MVYKLPDQLPTMHQTILAIVHNYQGCFTRSELAKVLVGSKSARISDLTDLPEYGRLAEHSRKTITFEIDILLQQNYLALDEHNKVTLSMLSHSTALGELPNQ